MGSRDEISDLLDRLNQGDDEARSQFVSAVHHELRNIAARHMRREREGHTLQTTALVNEAYLRLLHPQQVQWRDRVHFFATAATVMRRILVDHARRRSADKRGGPVEALPLDEGLVFSAGDWAQLVELDEVLHRLANKDDVTGRVVELRFFAGLSVEETAEAMRISPRSVARAWRFGRAWLRAELSPG